MSLRRSEVTSDRRKVGELGAAEEQEPPVGHPALAFGPFVAEADTGRLLESGQPVSLAPKPFETLYYLASHPGRVVPKTELMERLWPGTFVTDDVLVQCVVDIRRALHDPAKTPQYVQTVPRRGYQFLAPVRLAHGGSVDGTGEEGPALPASTTATLLERVAPRPFRLRGVWLYGAVALALLVASGIGLSAWKWTTGARLFPSAAPPVELGSLLVMPMTVEEPTPESGWLRWGLAEMIRSQLSQTPGIRVVARYSLEQALTKAGYTEEKGPSAEGASRIARGLRAEKLVTGSFVRVGEQFVLTAQVVDVPTGRTEGSASVRGRNPVDLLDAVDELCLKLLHNLTPSPGPGALGFRPARLATRSVEASRHYVEALVLQARGGRLRSEEAEQKLDEALKLDPSFAQAYVKKAEIQQWRRRWGYGNPDPEPAIRAAARLLKELPDRDRLLVESFEALILQQQPEVALRRWNALLQFYPTYAQEAGVPQLVADTFASLGRWDEVILVGETHVNSPSLPNAERARLASLLAQAFRRKGEFARAMELAQQAVDTWPTKEGPEFLRQRTALGRIALEAGRRVEALAECRAVAAAPEADVTNLTDAAWGLYMAGEPAEAMSLVDRALEPDKETKETYGNAHHLKGWLLMAQGRYSEAAASLLAAFEHTPRSFGNQHQGVVGADLAALYYAGVAHQLNGEWEKGEPVLERLIAYCRLQQARQDAGTGAADWQVANFLARALARLGKSAPEPARLQGDDTTYFVQTARLHAVQGRHQDALRELAQGLSLGHGELQHVRDDPDFASLRGDPEWKRITAAQPPR
jgi:DNA-binding winged helix-turn-helix (wHTH) protein/tetratricopeptide (TPR) repeat protein/TolB-like protein